MAQLIDAIFETRRAKTCIAVNNYKYRQFPTYVEKTVKFVCCNKSCKSVIVTDSATKRTNIYKVIKVLLDIQIENETKIRSIL